MVLPVIVAGAAAGARIVAVGAKGVLRGASTVSKGIKKASTNKKKGGGTKQYPGNSRGIENVKSIHEEKSVSSQHPGVKERSLGPSKATVNKKGDKKESVSGNVRARNNVLGTKKNLNTLSNSVEHTPLISVFGFWMGFGAAFFV